MRKKAALGFSIGIHLLIFIFFLLSPSSLSPPRKDSVVTFIFQEPPEEKPQKLTSRPLSSVEKSLYQKLTEKKLSVGVPVFAEVPDFQQKEAAPHEAVGITASFDDQVILPDFEPDDSLLFPSEEDIFFTDGESQGISKGQGVVSGQDNITWLGDKRKTLIIKEPEFPEILIQEGIEVDMEVKFFISPEGFVIDTDILKSSGYNSIDMAVEKIIGTWVFEKSDQGRTDSGVVPIRFRLKKKVDG